MISAGYRNPLCDIRRRPHVQDCPPHDHNPKIIPDLSQVDDAHATLARLREQTSDEDHAYFVDIAQFMADMPVDQASGVRWLDSEQHTRSRWRGLVIARQGHLHAGH